MNTCSCNNKGNDIPRLVRGNAFTLRITVKNPMLELEGTTLQDFALGESKDIQVCLVSRLGKRTGMTFAVEGAQIFIPFDGSQPSGVYGMEITGEQNGKAWRYYARPGELLEIVEPTSEAYIPQDDTVEGYLDVSASVGIVGVAKEILDKLDGIEEKATADSAIPVGTAADTAATDETFATASVNSIINAYL